MNVMRLPRGDVYEGDVRIHFFAQPLWKIPEHPPPPHGALGLKETKYHSHFWDSGLSFSQSNGAAPTTLLSAIAPGEHGVSLLHCRFDKGAYVSGVSRHHMVFLSLDATGDFSCNIDDRRLKHRPEKGNLTLCPEGAVCEAYSRGACEGLIIIVPRHTLSFAMTERTKAGSGLRERLEGHDGVLLKLGLSLARLAAHASQEGALAWHEMSEAIAGRLVEQHLSHPPDKRRGALSERALSRVIECIHARADDDVEVNELADAALQSRSHFPRLFRRATGLSPYQYVIKVRLERALSLARTTKLSLAEVAHNTGFADQSHMTRWFKRVYGASPARLMSGAA